MIIHPHFVSYWFSFVYHSMLRIVRAYSSILFRQSHTSHFTKSNSYKSHEDSFANANLEFGGYAHRRRRIRTRTCSHTTNRSYRVVECGFYYIYFVAWYVQSETEQKRVNFNPHVCVYCDWGYLMWPRGEKPYTGAGEQRAAVAAQHEDDTNQG